MLKVAIGVIDGSYPPKDEETEERLNPQVDFGKFTQTTEEVTEEHE